MITSAHCVAGCRIPNRHLSDCRGAAGCGCSCHIDSASGCNHPRGCWPNHRGSVTECTGCLPRLATTGRVCDRCRVTLAAAITTSPDIIIYLRSIIGDSTGNTVSLWRGRKATPPIPLRTHPVDAADGIFAALVWAVDRTCTTYSLNGPKIPHVWRRDGDVWGLAPCSSGTESVPLARWLTRQLDQIVAAEWSADLVATQDRSALRQLVHAARRAYPLEESPRVLTDATGVPLACPQCDRRALVWHPPSAVGLEVVVSCDATGCGYVLPPDQYDWTAKVLLTPEQAADRARARFAKEATK